jgi:small subunit ribosomal protein S14
MARKAAIEKSERKQKYMSRRTNRCKVCGRQRGYMRKFKLCRICFRMLASQGKLPGVTKSSW